MPPGIGGAVATAGTILGSTLLFNAVVGVVAAGIAFGTAKLLGTNPDTTVNQYAIGVPTIDMGSTTDIGYGLETPDVGSYFSSFDESFLAQNPYGSFAQLMNLYPNEMKARGYG